MKQVLAELNENTLLKYQLDDSGKLIIKGSKSEQQVFFKRITGINDLEEARSHALQAVSAIELQKDITAKAKMKKINHVWSLLEGIAPKDPIEGMIASQMVAIHELTLANAGKAANTGLSSEIRHRYINNTVKLSRTSMAQVEALKKYRSKGNQKIMVEHVNVASGGQAVVGSEIINN